MNDGYLLLEGHIAYDTETKLRCQRIDLRYVEQTMLQSERESIAEAVVSICSLDQS